MAVTAVTGIVDPFGDVERYKRKKMAKKHRRAKRGKPRANTARAIISKVQVLLNEAKKKIKVYAKE